MLNAQNIVFPVQLQKTMVAKLVSGDSLVYYQCHVEEATQQLATTSGQTLNTSPQKYSITEKFILYKDSNHYRVKYFISSLTSLPNRKFSGLKLREKPYWNYKLEKQMDVSEKAVKIMAALENKGKETNEYDFAITKYNTNQIIIKQGKNFKQLVIDGEYVLSRLILD